MPSTSHHIRPILIRGADLSDNVRFKFGIKYEWGFDRAICDSFHCCYARCQAFFMLVLLPLEIPAVLIQGHVRTVILLRVVPDKIGCPYGARERPSESKEREPQL